MPRIKETSAVKTKTRPVEEKMFETSEEPVVSLEVDLKVDTDVPVELEVEDEVETADDDASIDAEDLDPFKDTWEV